MRTEWINTAIICRDYHIKKTKAYQLLSDYKQEYEGTDKLIRDGRIFLVDRKTFEAFWRSQSTKIGRGKKQFDHEDTEKVRAEYEKLYEWMDWGPAPKKIDIFSMLEDVQIRMDLLKAEDNQEWLYRRRQLNKFVTLANAEMNKAIHHRNGIAYGRQQEYEIVGEEVDWEW